MPSASAEAGAAMLRMFGPQGGEVEEGWEFRAISRLEAAGYVLVKGEWRPKPGVTDLEDMTDDEWACMRYLIEEWDFGGLKTEKTNAE